MTDQGSDISLLVKDMGQPQSLPLREHSSNDHLRGLERSSSHFQQLCRISQRDHGSDC